MIFWKIPSFFNFFPYFKKAFAFIRKEFYQNENKKDQKSKVQERLVNFIPLNFF